MNATYPSPERSWQSPVSRVVKGMRLVDAGVTVKDRILLHLLDHWGDLQAIRAEWPVELTQEGIAGVVGISRSHVAVTLPDLIEDDMVEVTTQRVAGRPRRVKVYSLTFKGGAYAGRVAQQLLRTEVTAVDGTGDWEIPLDGLIQVHKVHMLSALRLVDEDNRVDLRKAADLLAPVEEGGVGEAVTDSEALEAGDGEAMEGADGEWAEVGTGDGPGTPAVEEVPPTVAPAPVPSPQAIGGTPDGYAGIPVSAGRRSDDWYGYTRLDPRPPPFFSPLRFGSGRRPSVPSVAWMLASGFFFLMAAVGLFGLSPGYCAVLWVPLVVVGGFLAWSGFKSTWALGPRREVWTAAALAAYMCIGVTMVAFAAFGQEVLVDLLWSGLVLGMPSLVLAAGTNRSVERRASFMLLIGPVMVLAALAMAVLDPGGMGRTEAMPLLIVTVGLAWTAVGWMMVQPPEDGWAVRHVVAGGSIGLAIAALAGAGDLASEGGLNPVLGTAVALWVLGAAYVAAIMLLPSLAPMRPDARKLYISLAVAGAAALLTAAVFFVWGGLVSVGVLEAVIGVGMVALVAPEMKDMGSSGRNLVLWGVAIATVTVLAVSVGL